MSHNEQLVEFSLKMIDDFVRVLYDPTFQPLARAQLEVDFFRAIRKGCWDRMQESNAKIWNATPPRIQRLSDAYAEEAP